MTQNPFEAPRARDVQTDISPAGTFDVIQTIREAWAVVSADFGTVIGVTIVGFLLAVLAEVTIIGIFLVLPVLVWGAVRFGLNLIDRRPAGFDDLFCGFKEYGTALGGMLMLMLCSVAILIPGYAFMGIGAAAESTPLMGAGYLMVVVTAIVIMLRFYFAVFFMVEQRMGAIDALKASWELTRNQKLNVFLLVILSQLVGAAGVLACFVGVLVSAPMSYLMFASAYRQMVGPPD